MPVAICVLLFCAVVIHVQATTLTVTNTNDSGPGSLRHALATANSGDTINFAVTGTVSLTSGELFVDKSLTISGPGLTILAVDGNETSRVFRIAPGKIVSISGLTLLNGSAGSENGGGILNDHAILTLDSCALQNSSAQSNRGGGFYNDGSQGSATLTILNSTVSGNYAYSAGGAIYNDSSGNRGSATLTITNCTINDNRAIHTLPFHGGAGGGIYNDSSGGTAVVTILNSTLHGNYTSSAGGGIYNDGDNGGSATLTIMNSTINGNGAAYDDIPFGGGAGGGIYNVSGTVTITACVVSNNGAGLPGPNFPTGTGGGISNWGTMTITDTTITNNGVYLAGGGISNGGTLTITGSTISGNRAEGQHDGHPFGHAGGIEGTVTLINSTLSDNFARLGGGGLEGGGVIKNSTISGNGPGGISTNAIEIGNTILDRNTVANIDGTATSLGYNISSDDGGGNLTGPGDQINTDPMIGPLQNNGGPTLTHALLPGSPAINAGDPNFTPPPSYDQRGNPFVRVFNGRIDIGSFETQPPRRRPRPTPAPRPTPG